MSSEYKKEGGENIVESWGPKTHPDIRQISGISIVGFFSRKAIIIKSNLCP